MPPTPSRARQEAYLDAMGVEVWHLRDAAPAPDAEPFCAPRLKLSPGKGGVLLVCGEDADSVSRLANDINRALGDVPVWAWPDADGAELAGAVEDNLFTTIAIFGQELAARLFGDELPVNLNSANVVLLPGMQDISGQGEARELLWRTLCRSGMVSHREHNA